MCEIYMDTLLLLLCLCALLFMLYFADIVGGSGKLVF